MNRTHRPAGQFCPDHPSAAARSYDVKSGSDATALDGTKYADWN